MDRPNYARSDWPALVGRVNVWLRVTRKCYWRFGGLTLRYEPGNWLYASPEAAAAAIASGDAERLFPERAA